MLPASIDFPTPYSPQRRSEGKCCFGIDERLITASALPLSASRPSSSLSFLSLMQPMKSFMYCFAAITVARLLLSTVMRLKVQSGLMSVSSRSLAARSRLPSAMTASLSRSASLSFIRRKSS